jgi:crotonobetainyl-CoA:carnitine CoA-transferase CaiB-like acyl-CoA transferase
VSEASGPARGSVAADGDLLGGCTVLELSTHVSGAYCGRLLALMGADVARWDAPLSLDCPPDRLTDAGAALGHGKRLVPEAGLAGALAAADIVIFDSLDDDDFDGTWMKLSRLLQDRLPAGTPAVDLGAIRLSAEGAGTAPAATDLVVGAIAGMSWAIGDAGAAPLALPYDIPAYLTGAEAAGAACLALLVRQFDEPAAGRWDVSEADVVASYVGQICSNFLPYERPWARDGARASKSGGFYPAAMFRCRDGFVSLFCRTNREWASLRAAMGNPEWSQRPGYEDGRIVARLHADAADVHLRAWAAGYRCDELVRLAANFGFPIARVLSVNEAREQEQFRVRGLVSDESGKFRIVSPPWQVRRATAAAPAPLRLQPTARKPLRGLRVLDFSWVWSGPMVTAALADLGADVIKIEGVARPDPSRLRGPAIRDGAPVAGPELELSPYFNQMNRGKRSVAIDITTERGASLVRDLAAGCDVVVENMRPGALDRRGLGYDDLAAVSPGLVMLSMSMMGQSGPLRDMGGYAPVMSGMTGLDSLIGYDPDQLIGLYNPALGDPNGAAHALPLLLAALQHRARTGNGSWLDLAQVECFLSILQVPVLLADSMSPVPPPANSHHRYHPHGTFRARGPDAWVAVAVRSEEERRRLAGLIGAAGPDATDLQQRLESWCAQQPASLASRSLSALGIPAAAVTGIEGVLSADWARARGLYSVTEHPYLGEQLTFGLTWKADGRVFGPARSAPLLGEHGAEVLASDLGLTGDEITELVADRVLSAPKPFRS